MESVRILAALGRRRAGRPLDSRRDGGATIAARKLGHYTLLTTDH
jgi:hypothetical protein